MIEYLSLLVSTRVVHPLFIAGIKETNAGLSRMLLSVAYNIYCNILHGIYSIRNVRLTETHLLQKTGLI